ncbi:MAG: hypothetical protein CR977_03875, partial [Gammaproteobacteria bacterium]
QLNAHAWTEVYIADKGWQRYDPTAAVAPNRINRGSPFGSARNTQSIALGARWENDSAAYRQFSATFRALNAFWQNWILNYDSDKQNSLWQRLGLGAFKYVAWLLLVLALIPLLLLIYWWYRRRQAARFGDDIYHALQPLLRHLDNHGLPIKPAQGLRDWLGENRSTLGEAHKHAENVVKHYYQCRYQHGETVSAEALAALNKAIALFIERHRLVLRQKDKA